MENQHLTERIIGCAMDVHRVLGPGLNEPVYEAAMCIELHYQGLEFERQPTFPAVYRDIRIGTYRPDLIVNNEVIIEIKAVSALAPVFKAQVLTYLKVTGLHTGLLLNFHSAVLREGLQRVVL